LVVTAIVAVVCAHVSENDRDARIGSTFAARARYTVRVEPMGIAALMGVSAADGMLTEGSSVDHAAVHDDCTLTDAASWRRSPVLTETRELGEVMKLTTGADESCVETVTVAVLARVASNTVTVKRELVPMASAPAADTESVCVLVPPSVSGQVVE
jgi:hypothetical protein